jgi:ABC-type polysaccharide/polyol phosphate transport system ATPase subunit
VSTAALELLDVHKRYRVYQERYRSLKEIVMHRRFGEWEDRWALSGVSLEVGHGETFGLIGPNGAGKSTALKLVAKILEPDRGEVRVRGRVSGLLELAAGFQPEYTGRENIYLNASLLGLSRRDIDARFDQIVDFAELQDHMDAPVRTYSSGMLMRLGFSVAINVEPQIMVVDEILAVGDEAFQVKCYAWLERFQAQGGTIVLVSHNLGQVRTVCSRVAWIMNGRVQFIGSPDDAADRYLAYVRQGVTPDARLAVVPGSGDAKRQAVELTQVLLRDRNGHPAVEIESGDPLTIDIAYHVNRRVETPVFGVALHRSDDVYVYGTNTWADKVSLEPLVRDGQIRLSYAKTELMSGIYRVTVAISDSHKSGTPPIDAHWQRHSFRVVSSRQDEGIVRLDHRWEVPKAQTDQDDAADSVRG